MKKVIFISILLAIILIGGLYILIGKKIIIDEKHYCKTDSDCVLSGSDPDGFGTCVNNIWNEEWRNNPESKNYRWECLSTGKEKCQCIKNKCQRTDSEPGC